MIIPQEFVAALHWTNNDLDSPIELQIQLPASNSALIAFRQFLKDNKLSNMTDENVDEMVKNGVWLSYQLSLLCSRRGGYYISSAGVNCL